MPLILSLVSCIYLIFALGGLGLQTWRDCTALLLAACDCTEAEDHPQIISHLYNVNTAPTNHMINEQIMIVFNSLGVVKFLPVAIVAWHFMDG